MAHTYICQCDECRGRSPPKMDPMTVPMFEEEEVRRPWRPPPPRESHENLDLFEEVKP